MRSPSIRTQKLIAAIVLYRERRVSELLLQGMSNKEIGFVMHLACRTVKAYINKLFLYYDIEKGGIRRVKLAAYLFMNRKRLCLAEFTMYNGIAINREQGSIQQETRSQVDVVMRPEQTDKTNYMNQGN